eukprot:6466622-Amphidinium_carterae.1
MEAVHLNWDLVHAVRNLRDSPDQRDHKWIATVFDQAALSVKEKMRSAWSLNPVTGPTGYEVDLVVALLERASDPELDLPVWLAGGTPLGIEVPIVARGVIPEASDTPAKHQSAEFLLMRQAQGMEFCGNYSSCSLFGQETAIELQRLVDQGAVEVFASWESVRARWPKAVATRVATI